MRLRWKNTKNQAPAEAAEHKEVTGAQDEGATPKAKLVSRWNALCIRPRDIVKIWIDEPLGAWYEYGGRPISIVQESNGSGITPWHPSQHNICSVKDESEALDIRTPKDLFETQDWAVVRAVYSQQSNLWEKLNTGLMFALVVVLFFFMYLVFSEIKA